MIFVSMESMILVSMETLYYDTKQLFFGLVNFKFTWGGNHPLKKTCYPKKIKKERKKNNVHVINT